MSTTGKMKFLFETSFDPAKGVVRPPLAPKPQFTEQDLATARGEGFAEGEAAGRAAALASIEQASLKALASIGQQLTDGGRQIEELRATTAADALKIVKVALDKILPQLARHNALNEIERLVGECLQAIYDEPRVVVRAQDRLIAALQPRVDQIAGSCGFQGKVVLFADERLGESDVRVEWADGGAERNLEDMFKQIDTAIESITQGDAAVSPISDKQAPDTGI